MAARKVLRATRRRPLTDGELTHAAVVTYGDVTRARKKWREHAPAALRDLLDAVPLAPRPGRRKSGRADSSGSGAGSGSIQQ